MLKRKKEEVSPKQAFRLIHSLYNGTEHLTASFKEHLIKAAGQLEQEQPKVDEILAQLYQPTIQERQHFSPNCPALLEALYEMTMLADRRLNRWSRLGLVSLIRLK